MAMDGDMRGAEAAVPISGRRLALPEGPIFHLRRAAQSHFEIGEFRAWAGYKNFDSDAATNDLAHFQHVLTYAGSETTGRTGIHCHLAHAHIIIPTSGRGVFSYDGVITPAVPGAVIVQHGGTVHDQFDYSYAPASAADNSLTPLSIEPASEGAPLSSFAFLELFVPKVFANVEIVPPEAVTEADQGSAWDHPYHAASERFHLQPADAPAAAYRPVAGREDIEARDAGTWEATGGLVATWFIRPATADSRNAPDLTLEIPGESGGIDILFMVAGTAQFLKADGEEMLLEAGDTLTHSQGLVGDPFACSPDMRLIRFFIAARTQNLRERTPAEIDRLEALGARIITRREVRPPDDARPVNLFQAAGLK
jgi:hypothetical protein